VSEEKKETDFTIAPFAPEDGPGIRDLFLAVYGEHYPVRTYYDPQALVESCAKNETIIFVAKDAFGRVMGQTALFINSPYKHIYESGSGAVYPSYRGWGISTRLMVLAFSEVEYLSKYSVEGIWGEAVANHTGMQKIIPKTGAKEMGLEIDLMPAAAYDKEKSASGRVGAVTVYKTITPRPHTVYLPPVYDETLRFFYQDLAEKRRFETAHEPPPEAATEVSFEIYGFAEVARLAVSRSGRDFETVFGELEEKIAAENKPKLIQVSIRLDEPWNRAGVEVLRNRGYFLGAVLPRWFDSDGLLMQKVFGRPNWEGLALYSDRVKKLRDLVFADWEATKSGD
jgi:GNAT superfamily N-acetyltransferase